MMVVLVPASGAIVDTGAIDGVLPPPPVKFSDD
jgi:hypothetical protein